MSNTVYISEPIFEAICAIKQAGHGIEVKAGVGGISHITTYLVIGVRHPGERSYVNRLKIRHVLRSGGESSGFSAISADVGTLFDEEHMSVDEYLRFIERNVATWHDNSNNDPAWPQRMACT